MSLIATEEKQPQCKNCGHPLFSSAERITDRCKFCFLAKRERDAHEEWKKLLNTPVDLNDLNQRATEVVAMWSGKHDAG